MATRQVTLEEIGDESNSQIRSPTDSNSLHPPNYRNCGTCGETKPLEEFYLHHGNYRIKHCKLCCHIKQKKQRERNRDNILESKRKYYQENKEKLNEISKEWRRNNLIRAREIERNSYYKNIDYYRGYRADHKERTTEWARKWREKNPHITAWRSLLKTALLRMGNTKEGHTIDLLGYSAKELKEHLESQFQDGMSWDNYGEWEIDHINPITSFSSDTPQHIVNSLSNLQPLWKLDNIRKGNKDFPKAMKHTIRKVA